MDFNRYRIKINLKTCCLYEVMTGDNFFMMAPENSIKLLYCSLVVNNPDMLMTYETFLEFLNDREVAKWLGREYKHIMDFNQQFNTDKEEDGEEQSGETQSIVSITDITTSLIMQHKMDPHYVMYEMDLWEITPYFKTADNVRKLEQVEKRFWSYLQICPMIDGKKVKGPRDLLQFEWEKEEIKKEREQELKNNEYAIKHTIGQKLNI